MKAEAFAPAKINLTLHVIGQRADDYHLLDSLVAFADLGDQLTLTSGPELSVEVSGEFADGVPCGVRNLVWRAAEALAWTGHVHLEKRLPHGGGIGGGSSDAAAVLRTLIDQGDKMGGTVPLSLGADVPVCMLASAARMRGIGERVEPVTLPSLPALLVNPGIAVRTEQVFSALKDRANAPMPAQIPTPKTPEECADWLQDLRNDLEPAAKTVASGIAEVIDVLGDTRGALLTRMSGSGSTCFALYPTIKAAQLAAHEIGAAHPGWWCRATLLS